MDCLPFLLYNRSFADLHGSRLVSSISISLRLRSIFEDARISDLGDISRILILDLESRISGLIIKCVLNRSDKSISACINEHCVVNPLH